VDDNLWGHAEVADDRVDWLVHELMVGRPLDVSDDEFGLPDVPDARVGACVLDLDSIHVHPRHLRPDARGDEGEAPFPRPDVEHAHPAEVLVPKLVEQHGPEGVGLPRRLPPGEGAAHADDIRQPYPPVCIGRTK
jgi:hypothetical protein